MSSLLGFLKSKPKEKPLQLPFSPIEPSPSSHPHPPLPFDNPSLQPSYPAKALSRFSCIQDDAVSSYGSDVRNELCYGSSSQQQKSRRRTKGASGKEIRGTSPSRMIPSVTRKNFSTVKNVRPDETFTNHECLPSLDEAYMGFVRVYPEYLDTAAIDAIRHSEYPYLDATDHVCVDYSGYGLFSQSHSASSAAFGLSYISANIATHACYGGADQGTVEFDVKKRIYQFLNIQESEYAMVFTASRESAFKLLAESYPFHIKKRLLTVYDYECDAVNLMEEIARKRGAEVSNALFMCPSQRIKASDLRKKLLEKNKRWKKKLEEDEPGQGLLVFPLQSRVTGAKYSYQWMYKAKENGWEVLLDALALMPKALGSLGLSVFRPDFIVTSFFKVYGLDPTGFGCLFIKHCAIQKLLSTSSARGVGMVRLLPVPMRSERSQENDGKVANENQYNCCHSSKQQSEGKQKTHALSSSDSAQLSGSMDYVHEKTHIPEDCDLAAMHIASTSELDERNGSDEWELNEVSDRIHRFYNHHTVNQKASCSHIESHSISDKNSAYFTYAEDSDHPTSSSQNCKLVYENNKSCERKDPEVTCRGLDHAETLGHNKTNTRIRCLINWLIGSLLKLHHPGSPGPNPLVQIYGPKLNFDRGASVAFNLFDWNGVFLQPLLVQRLADRSNIAIGVSTLQYIKLSANLQDQVNRGHEIFVGNDKRSPHIEVNTIALGLLSNFGDVYKLWTFLAKFLDADFVSKEVWRYRSLNQEMVVLGIHDSARFSLH